MSINKNTVIIEELKSKFYQHLYDMNYICAAEVIGALKLFGEKTDVFEVELLFEEKKYDQIIHSYMPVVKAYEEALLDFDGENKLDNSIIPDHKVYEYIAASYSMLGSHDRSWQMFASSRDDDIVYDEYCYEYCKWMAYLSGNYSDWEGQWNGSQACYGFEWENRLHYLIALKAAVVYRDNEAAIDVKENSSEPNEFKELKTNLLKRISKLSWFDDTLFRVKCCIEEEKRFSENVIIGYLLECVRRSFDVGDRPESLSELHDKLKKLSGSDIIKYLDIERILSPLTAYRDMTDFMKDRISFLLSIGNRDLANTIFDIYYNVLYADAEEKSKLLKVDKSLNYWEEILFEYYNDNLYSKKMIEYENSTVSKSLTPHGAIMYKAAQWQLMKMTEDPNAHIDAGMLCLSYMRIIEYELNHKVTMRIIPYIDTIIAARNAQIDLITAMKDAGEITEKKAINRIKNINERWGEEVLEKIRDSKDGVELGKLSWFFQNFMKNWSKDVKVISSVAEKILKDEKILSNSGLVALKQSIKNPGNEYRFVDMTNKERREKYRNPPAHTRFVSLSTAFECVEYVNKAIIKIDEYTLK